MCAKTAALGFWVALEYCLFSAIYSYLILHVHRVQTGQEYVFFQLHYFSSYLKLIVNTLKLKERKERLIGIQLKNFCPNVTTK